MIYIGFRYRYGYGYGYRYRVIWILLVLFCICICIFMCMMFNLIDGFSYYYHKYPRFPRIYNNNRKKNG